MTHTKIKRKIATIVKVGAKKMTSGVPERPLLVCYGLIMKVIINNWCMLFIRYVSIYICFSTITR